MQDQQPAPLHLQQVKPLNGAVASALGVPQPAPPPGRLRFEGAQLVGKEHGLALPDGTTAGRFSALRLMFKNENGGPLIGFTVSLQRGSAGLHAAQALTQLAKALIQAEDAIAATENTPEPADSAESSIINP